MNQKVFVQFAFPLEKIKKFLDKILSKEIIQNIQVGMFPSIILEKSTAEAKELQNLNVLLEGKHIIRLIRNIVELKEDDINLNDFYELRPAATSESELNLKEKPSYYYNLELECIRCGRYKWEQTKDFEIARRPKLELDETHGGELILSKRLSTILKQEKISKIEFRKLKNFPDYMQIVVKEKATVILPNNSVIERDNCALCGLPRIIAFERSNGKSLFTPPFDVPRIEKIPKLYVNSIATEIAQTNIEFGTLGRFHDNETGLTKYEFPYKTSKPKWVVSGRLVKILYREKIRDFQIGLVNQNAIS